MHRGVLAICRFPKGGLMFTKNVRRGSVLVVFLVSILTGLTKADAPATFAGTFKNEKFAITLTGNDNAYAGAITMGADQYPVKAIVKGEFLVGTFTAGADQFEFTATLDGATMSLTTGGKTKTLKRAVKNPLADVEHHDAAPATAPAAAPNNTPAPRDDKPISLEQSLGNFSVLGATATGRTLFIKLPNAANIESTITQTADELAKVFGAKPELSGAFADAKTKNKGGASLAAGFQDHAVKGVILSSTDG